MALVAATLGAALASMTPVDNEAQAVQSFVDAWDTYFSLSGVMGVPTNPGSLQGALSAMQGAMTGMSADGAGAASIQAGITAFWGVVATSSPTIWTTVPPNTSATPPPGLGGIAAAVSAVFTANVQGKLSLAAAASALANAVHPTQLGGICILPTAPAGPGPQPIL
jgi:hypothetical protein